MEAIEIQSFKKRSVRSVAVLTSRTVLLQLINFTGYFFITVFLGRAEFGFFILVSAIIDILAYFSDVGLAAALIQKKKKPTLKEIRSTFTIQETIVVFLISILFLFSSLIKRFYQLDQEGVILLYSVALAFLLSSLKTIPSVLLERKLKFNKIIIPQFAETISFNLIVVLLAWKGWGLRSYTVAVLARAVLGTLTMYLIAPWNIGLDFSFKTLKKLLNFGVPYQLNSLLATIKDKFMILILGGIIGSEGLALVGWAEKWATMPLRYFLDNTVKVAFPAFARLQHDKARLKIAVGKSFYFLSFLILPSLAGIVVIAQPLVNLIPRWSKWQPALAALFLYCLASAGGSLAVFLTTLFNAIGKIRTTFKLMIFWTILTWVLTPFLAFKLGFLGVALATVLVNFSSIAALFILKKYLKVNLFSQVIGPLLASIFMLACSQGLKKYLSLNLFSVFLIVLFGILIYTSVIALINKRKLTEEIRFLFQSLKG